MALSDLPQQGINAIQSGRSYLDNLANQYIVKPKNVKGIAGFVFDYEGESNVSFQADITEHFTESNQPAMDHIAIKPVKITLHGFVSELTVLPPQGLLGAIASLQSKLTVVPAYLGKYTPQAAATLQSALTKAQSTVQAVDQGIARAQNIVGLLGNASPATSKQQRAFSQLRALGFPTAPPALLALPGSQLPLPQIFVVETPYAIFDNMAMESLTFVQPEDTKDWSDIVVTLKQMRFVDTQIKPSFNLSTRTAQQTTSLLDNGQTRGTQVLTSTLYKLQQFALSKN